MIKLFKNVRLKGQKELKMILVEDGTIKKIAEQISVPDEAEVIDLQGYLTIPPYVDPHIHLDYVFTARKEGALNGTGTLFEGIQRWSETKSDLTVEEVKQRAIAGIKRDDSRSPVYSYSCRCNRPEFYLFKSFAGIKRRIKRYCDDSGCGISAGRNVRL